jgi:hypothetical protein
MSSSLKAIFHSLGGQAEPNLRLTKFNELPGNKTGVSTSLNRFEALAQSPEAGDGGVPRALKKQVPKTESNQTVSQHTTAILERDDLAATVEMLQELQVSEASTPIILLLMVTD